MEASLSNARARTTWEVKAVGSQRSAAPKATRQYFDDLRAYRYGYETPFIPRLFDFPGMHGKRVLEIGVGNGIDGVEMARHGAAYTGLDITHNHIELAQSNFQLSLPDAAPRFVEGDLLETDLGEKSFDAVYSFGTLHHIAHEPAYLRRIHELLTDDGELLLAVYSKYSFFNAYMSASWLLRQRGRMPLDHWRSHFAEGSPIDQPVVIKIRSRREVQAMLAGAGFSVVEYHKRGFVQKYIPVFGKLLAPDGVVLNALGSVLGWYHLFKCRKDKESRR